MKTSELEGARIYKTTPNFWRCYYNLPREVQQQTDYKFELLKLNPKHPSLHLKKVGIHWGVRINKNYRALASEDGETLVWFWIEKHDEYMRQIREYRLHRDDFIQEPNGDIYYTSIRHNQEDVENDIILGL